jgi:hypothetical protein
VWVEEHRNVHLFTDIIATAKHDGGCDCPAITFLHVLIFQVHVFVHGKVAACALLMLRLPCNVAILFSTFGRSVVQTSNVIDIDHELTVFSDIHYSPFGSHSYQPILLFSNAPSPPTFSSPKSTVNPNIFVIFVNSLGLF